jgi:NAD(P)-dependent dehydrogenase (short-subunit alcohol dehydrogenase family)
MKLRVRQVLITGSSRGLGRQVVQAFWQEGASLLLVACTASDLARVEVSLLPTSQAGQTVQRTDIYTLRRIVTKDRGLDWGNV